MADRLYIRGFPSTYTRDDLKSKFSIFGRIKKLFIVTKESKLYAIVRYYNPNNAKKAIEALNSHVSDGITWFVAICEKLNVRKMKFVSENRVRNMENYSKTLYLTDFPESCTEETFRETFERFGSIASIKLDGKKAFLTFNDSSAAKTANKEIKPLYIEGKRVYVAKLVQIGKISNHIWNKKLNKAYKKEEVNKDEKKESEWKEPQEEEESEESGMDLFGCRIRLQRMKKVLKMKRRRVNGRNLKKKKNPKKVFMDLF